jgi:SAM-dependent methyltransferase
MSSELEPSGERVIEDAYHRSLGAYVIYVMHAASYAFAEPYCIGRRVLDLGCGSGYGSARIASIAASVVGVDVAADAVQFAQTRYTSPNLEFRVVEPDAPLPFEDCCFDVVLSFQVIEHVTDDVGYLKQARRILRPGGVMIVITPDRRHRLLPGQKPWNRWHLREYSRARLASLVGSVLKVEAALVMGAPPEIAGVELRRYRLTKWLTLPFTLPFLPDGFRRYCLDRIHAIKGAGKPVAAEAQPELKSFDFDETAIQIAEQVHGSLNLVVVAHRPVGNDE